MTIEVEGPDGVINEFPDDMSEARIRTIMMRTYGGPGVKAGSEPPSKVESAGRGVADTFTLGASDELNAAARQSPLLSDKAKQFKPWMANPIDALAGAGKMAYEKLTGGAPSASAGYDAALPEERGARNAAQEENPWSYMGGQLGGGALSAMMTPVPGAALAGRLEGAGQSALGLRMAGGALAGSGAGAAYGFNSGEGGLANRADEAAKGATVGGILGGAIPGVIGAGRRMVTPLPTTAARQGAVQTLADEGITGLTAGQRTGSKPLQWFESALGDMPGAGGAASELEATGKRQLNTAVMKRIGSNADTVAPEAVDDAVGAIGDTYKKLAARNTLKIDEKFGQDVGDVLGQYNKVLAPKQKADVAEIAADILDRKSQFGSKGIPGEQYQADRSRLTTLARGAKDDAELSQAYKGLRDALDSAMGRSITPEDKLAWQTANRQYANWKKLQKALTTATDGNVSPQKLRSVVASGDNGQFARGKGDFADLARAADVVMKPLPNSGTAPRQWVQHAITAGSAALGGGLGGIPGAIGGLAAPGIAGRLLLSRPVQGYLGNQALADLTASQREAILRTVLSGQGAVQGPLLDGSSGRRSR